MAAAAPAAADGANEGWSLARVSAQLNDGGPLGTVLAGGVGIAAVGIGLGMARSSTRLLTTAARRRLTTTLEVTSKDPSYPWVLQWLKEHTAASARPLQHLSVQTTMSTTESSNTTQFELVPAPGRHFVSYAGWPVLVERAREYSTVNTSSGTPWEKLTLTALATRATRNGALFTDLLHEAKAAAEASRDEGLTTLYTSWGTEWRPFGRPRPKRRLDSVVLKQGLCDSIVADVQDWHDSASWYRGRGVPYRRGYLLHGPPGGGKTSFVLALAAHFNLDVCLLSLSDEGLSDDRLALSLANVPPNSLVLLEDVDAAFINRDSGSRRQATASSSLTLSGLLNALDGAAASEGRVVLMTTNYKDRLDSALLRPGRVDVVHELGYATEDQAARLFAAFFDDDVQGEAPKAFAKAALAAAQRAANRGPSMAELQAYLLTRKHDSLAALAEADALCEVLSSRTKTTTATVVEEEETGPVARPRRRISASDVDRMVFNPQPGWEDEIGKVK